MQTLTPFAGQSITLALTAVNYGKTETKGVYIQDAWKFWPQWKLIAGGRGEFWRAYNGSNVAGGLTAGSTNAAGIVPVARCGGDGRGKFPGRLQERLLAEGARSNIR